MFAEQVFRCKNAKNKHKFKKLLRSAQLTPKSFKKESRKIWLIYVSDIFPLINQNTFSLDQYFSTFLCSDKPSVRLKIFGNILSSILSPLGLFNVGDCLPWWVAQPLPIWTLCCRQWQGISHSCVYNWLSRAPYSTKPPRLVRFALLSFLTSRDSGNNFCFPDIAS